MKNSSTDISGKLPEGLTALYGRVHRTAMELDIPYLVVGAMARDLVLVHGFGARIERGTRDLDFAIDVADWATFNRMRDSLLAEGFVEDGRIPHKLHFEAANELPWEIDIIPFGEIGDEESSIAWPPDNERVMRVLGFKEAHANSLQVKVQANPEVVIPVASPAGMSLLKLVTWLDREGPMKRKDALDLAYLMASYSKIPDILKAIYEEGYMEAQDWVEPKAAAMKLGVDAGRIASPETHAFFAEELNENEAKRDELARDMAGAEFEALDEFSELLNSYLTSLMEA